MRISIIPLLAWFCFAMASSSAQNAPEKPSDELATLRESWKHAKAEAVKPLDEGYRVSLEKLRDRLEEQREQGAASEVTRELQALYKANHPFKDAGIRMDDPAKPAGETPGPTIKVLIIGAVWDMGRYQFPAGTRMETALNTAICHEGSSLKKIRVTRFIAGTTTNLIVSVVPADNEKSDFEEFVLQDRDIITVNDRWFDHTASQRPRLVKERFVLTGSKP